MQSIGSSPFRQRLQSNPPATAVCLNSTTPPPPPLLHYSNNNSIDNNNSCADAEAATSRLLTVVPPCNCTVLIFLHLRKCGGTTVRSVLRGQLQKHGWYSPIAPPDLPTISRIWSNGCQSTSSCWMSRRVAMKIPPFSAHTRWFLEVHTSPGIEKFIQQVEELRRVPALRGCKVVSAAFLRDPRTLVRSEFEYFRNEPEKRGLTFSDFVHSKPEMLLFGSRGHPALVERLIRLPKEYEIINTYSFLGLSPALLNGSFSASSPSPPPPPGLRRAEEAFAAALIASRPPQRGEAPRSSQEDAKLHMDAVRAHAGWVRELKASGFLPCDLVVKRASDVLERLDFVGMVER